MDVLANENLTQDHSTKGFGGNGLSIGGWVFDQLSSDAFGERRSELNNRNATGVVARDLARKIVHDVRSIRQPDSFHKTTGFGSLCIYSSESGVESSLNRLRIKSQSTVSKDLSASISKKALLESLNRGAFVDDRAVSSEVCARLLDLMRMALDPHEPAPTIPTSSLVGFFYFLTKIKPNKAPRLFLSEKGHIRALWRKSATEKLTVAFLGERDVSFSVVSSRGQGNVERMAGFVSLDSISRVINVYEASGLVSE